MADLKVKTFDEIVAEQAVAAQAEVPDRALPFTVGTVFRALAESFATVGLWLQAQVLRVLAATRASTSRGSDLDTWMADYFLARAPAAAARGEVTFSRFTTALSALVPAGATAKTPDGVHTFTVIANTGHPSWDVAQNGYVVAPGAASITVPVVAAVTGSAGNVGPGTVTLLSSAMPAIDTVTNATAMSGGADAEGDDALRARFRAYIGALPRATRAAIDYAVGGVQAGLSWTVMEGQLPDGTPAPAYFTLVVDNGTGSPPSDLLARVAAAVEQVRALGVSYAVIAPQVLLANVTMTITVDPVADRPAVVGKVADALVAYINAIPQGQGLSYSRLTQIGYSASPYVQNITAVLLNGATADLAGEPRRAIRAGVVAVS